VGVALLAFALMSGVPKSDSARAMHNVLTFLALLLASGGSFMALCTGTVLFATLLASPRSARRQKSS
jgi:hypothetical protein